MQELLAPYLSEGLSPYLPQIKILSALISIGAGGIIVHFLSRYASLLILHGIQAQKESTSEAVRLHDFITSKLLSRVGMVLQALVLNTQILMWVSPDYPARESLMLFPKLFLLTSVFFVAFSLLDGVIKVSNGTRIDQTLPLSGIVQGIKLIITLVLIVMAISLVLDKSPFYLLSGLGAMTAVILLVFKDAILGFVAGIQLSANRMLKKGDWLEMTRYGADGAVEVIGLTTVKVRNWDNTITTIPTYALISDSFRNWRGMTESGARRLKRSVSIDVNTIGFLTEDQIQELRSSRHLSQYLQAKQDQIAVSHSSEQSIDRRRLTNIGTLRAYLESYLRFHPCIHQGMTLMVRQLDPDENGLPIEIYAFTNTIIWSEYESIQSDIFDHLYAVLPRFGLQAHQSPTGRELSQAIHR